VILGFRCKVDKISSGILLAFWDNLSVSSSRVKKSKKKKERKDFLILEDGADRLSQNVSKE
jgi:hypothetical protein